ncbi:MAG: GtrA family protein [Candidatus Saccharimonadales bacterium]
MGKKITQQFIRYLVAAGIGYVVDFGGLYVLHEFFGIHYLIAAAISFTIGLIVVYILSNLFVFSDSKIHNKSLEFGIFALIGIVGLGILSLLMWVMVGIIGINYLLAKILATVVVYIWNFFARRAMYHN